MPDKFVGTTALTELWAKVKANFARKLGVSTTATTVSLQLKNEAGDSINSAATFPAATTTAAGAMSADDKSKLNGITAGAEPNQNAFGNVTVGSTNIQADSITDTLTLTAGTNITLTPDATNDEITIAATDTTYSDATTSASGLMSSTDKTKLNGIATGATANEATTTTPKMNGTAAVGSETAYAKGDHVHPTDTSRAPLASPAFTGTPTAPTATSGTNTTQIATTAFVAAAISASEAGSITFQGTIDAQSTLTNADYKAGWYWVVHTAGTYANQTCEVGDMIYAIATKSSSYSDSDFSVIQNNVDMTLYATLASPALTGTPTAPTAAKATDTTQLATTAFVHTVAGDYQLAMVEMTAAEVDAICV